MWPFCTDSRPDREGLADRIGELLVGFGAMSGQAPDDAEVARTAADAFRAAGLTVEWDGSPSARILVSPFAWSMPFHDPEE